MTMPSLSIVLATTDAWPDLANCLAVLEPQAERAGAEIIVAVAPFAIRTAMALCR